MHNQEKPCNILVQDADLRRLQDLNPSVMNGFTKIYQQDLAITIRFEDLDERQIIDKQNLTVSIYERGHKNPDIIKVQITSEVDLFLNLCSTITVQSYEEIKKMNRFNTNFKEYVGSMLRIFENSERPLQGEKDSNQIELHLSSNTGQASTLRVVQNTQYKQLQILSLKFYPTSPQKVNQSILFRYNFKKAKLKVLENSIESIYTVLQQTNPSLLQYIIRTVGLISPKEKP